MNSFALFVASATFGKSVNPTGQGVTRSANSSLCSLIACRQFLRHGRHLDTRFSPTCCPERAVSTSLSKSHFSRYNQCAIPTHSGMPMPRCRAEPQQSHSLRSIAHRLPPMNGTTSALTHYGWLWRTALTATSSLRLRASQGARQCRLQSALLLMATPHSLRSEVSANARASFHQHTRSALVAVPTPSLLFAPSGCRSFAHCRLHSHSLVITAHRQCNRCRAVCLRFAPTHTHDERLTAQSARSAWGGFCI